MEDLKRCTGMGNTATYVYTASGNTSFNEYTGREDFGGGSTFELPIPMVFLVLIWKY